MWRFNEPKYDLQPVSVNGRQYGVDIIPARGRTASASLRNGVIVIRMPKFARGREAESLFLNLKGRLAKSLERHPERFEKHKLSFENGQVLTLFGKNLEIVLGEAPGERAFAKAYDDRIVVKLPYSVDLARKEELVTRLVSRAISRSLLPVVSARVVELNSMHFNSKVNRVRLKQISSRWGSYSKKSRNISLNLKLLFAPPEILDYVIVHELSHGFEHNHGPKFWRLVSNVIPEYKERRKWLTKNGDMLGKASSHVNVAKVPGSVLLQQE